MESVGVSGRIFDRRRTEQGAVAGQVVLAQQRPDGAQGHAPGQPVGPVFERFQQAPLQQLVAFGDLEFLVVQHRVGVGEHHHVVLGAEHVVGQVRVGGGPHLGRPRLHLAQELEQAPDVAAAEQLFAPGRFGLVLCDQNLPDGPGDDLARRLVAAGEQAVPPDLVETLLITQGAGDGFEWLQRQGSVWRAILEAVVLDPDLADRLAAAAPRQAVVADLLVAVGTRFVCQSDCSRTGYPHVQAVMNNPKAQALVRDPEVLQALASGRYGLPADSALFVFSALAHGGLISLLKHNRPLPIELLRLNEVEVIQHADPGDAGEDIKPDGCGQQVETCYTEKHHKDYGK